jgi:uncharacterized protein involved in propanediol utilization
MMTKNTNGVSPHSYSNCLLPGTGSGRSIAQHGELFQGLIEDRSNRRRRCLVSLPCSAMYSEATFSPDASGSIGVSPSHKKKSRQAADLTLAYLKAKDIGGVLNICSTIPEGKGLGSSTADCIAVVHAVADSLKVKLRDAEVARLVVEAEVASDNIMFSRAVLFAHREGEVIEDFGREVPKMVVLGIDTAQESHVNTLEYPPAVYSWRQLQSFCTLTAALRRAIHSNDINLLGRVATASSQINQLFLPKKMFNEVREIAHESGALGVACAHSGTVLSVLLDPDDKALEHRIDRIMESLSRLNISDILRFQT